METNTNNSYSDEIEIDLGEVLMLMLHNLWIIVLCAIIGGIICFCISKFAITPLYESSTQVYILNEKDSNTALTSSDLQLGSQLTKDYAELIKSRSVLEKVIENLQLNETYGSLLERVAVSNTADTRILKITATDPEPLWAQSIADEIRNVASDHIINVMGIEAVNVVDYANLPILPASPSIKKWTAIGVLVGAFLCMVVILIRFLLDDTVKTSEDVEKFLNMSTLAMVPMMDAEEAVKEKAREQKIIKSNEADMGKAPVAKPYEKEVPIREIAKEAPVRETSAKEAPVRETSTKEVPVREIPKETQTLVEEASGMEGTPQTGSRNSRVNHSSEGRTRKGRR